MSSSQKLFFFFGNNLKLIFRSGKGNNICINFLATQSLNILQWVKYLTLTHDWFEWVFIWIYTKTWRTKLQNVGQKGTNTLKLNIQYPKTKSTLFSGVSFYGEYRFPYRNGHASTSVSLHTSHYCLPIA